MKRTREYRRAMDMTGEHGTRQLPPTRPAGELTDEG